MLPVILTFVRTYAPIFALPFAAAVGVIGYNIEAMFRGEAPSPPSLQERREQRLINELLEGTDQDPLDRDGLVPKTIFGKNRTPSLGKRDE